MKWIQEKYTIIKTWMNLSFLSFEIEVHFLTLLHLLFNSSLFPDARFGLLSVCLLHEVHSFWRLLSVLLLRGGDWTEKSRKKPDTKKMKGWEIKNAYLFLHLSIIPFPIISSLPPLLWLLCVSCAQKTTRVKIICLISIRKKHHVHPPSFFPRHDFDFESKLLS